MSLEEETKGESNSHLSVVLRHLRFSMRNVDQRLDVARSGPIQAQPNEESASISPSSPSKLNLSPGSFHPPSPPKSKPATTTHRFFGSAQMISSPSPSILLVNEFQNEFLIILLNLSTGFSVNLASSNTIRFRP